MAVSVSSAIPVGPGVSTRASRRRFTAEYKAWVVQEAERCREAGEIGGLLRREGLFSSQLTDWRKLYQAGARRALSRKRGPKAKGRVETQQIERTIERITRSFHDETHAGVLPDHVLRQTEILDKLASELP